jgi:RNA polymerase sigma-70 factor (ECF subfamily)
MGGSDAHLRLLNLPDQEPDEHADSDVSATGSLTYRALNIIRREVRETTWLAFWRSTIDEIAPAAVAEELDISIESVWQARSRILRRARQLLE